MIDGFFLNLIIQNYISYFIKMNDVNVLQKRKKKKNYAPIKRKAVLRPQYFYNLNYF